MAINHRSESLLLASEDDVSLLRSVDALQPTEVCMAALCFSVSTWLRKEYDRVLLSTDSLLDTNLREVIQSYLPRLDAQQIWAGSTLERWREHPDVIDIASRIAAKPHPSKLIPLDRALWPPLERAPSALRPEGASCGRNGALPITATDPLHVPRDIGIFIHNSINEEYTTLELVGRNSYEHPLMPWEFHMSMARQVADEARHAQILERLAASFDVQFGQYPMYVTNYDMIYSFSPCEEGSDRELLWRLLLRSTYQEAQALDSLNFEIRKRRFAGQSEMAIAFHYILADELFHVENGLRWSRFIATNLGLDMLRERSAARDYYRALETHERLRYIVQWPDLAVADAMEFQRSRAHLDSLPFSMQLEIGLRRRAGFSDEDIDQAQTWGL